MITSEDLRVDGLGKEARYLFAISGGHDSVALLPLLIDRGYRNLVLCHLNHQLRGEASELDAALVRDLGRELGMQVEIGLCDVAKLSAESKTSLETAARNARHRFLASCAKKYETRRVFLAHHADDQVETVLMNLIRGTGTSGLAGMSWVQRLAVDGERLELIRPILHIFKDQLPSPARYREDETNAENDFFRNRVRNQLLPLIEEISGREPRGAIRRTAEIVEADEFYLAEMTTMMLKLSEAPDGKLVTPKVMELPIGMQRRVLRRWLSGYELSDIGFREVENVRRLLEPNASVAKVNLPGGRFVRRREKRLFVE